MALRAALCAAGLVCVAYLLVRFRPVVSGVEHYGAHDYKEELMGMGVHGL